MGDFLEYAVSKCDVVEETGASYTIYDYSEGINDEGNCGKSDADVILQKVVDGDSYRFDLEYILFLFSGLENSSEYSLVCEVMLCLADDNSSVCKTVADDC